MSEVARPTTRQDRLDRVHDLLVRVIGKLRDKFDDPEDRPRFFELHIRDIGAYCDIPTSTLYNDAIYIRLERKYPSVSKGEKENGKIRVEVPVFIENHLENEDDEDQDHTEVSE